MGNFAQDLQEFLHSICDVVGDEVTELDEIAVHATAKFGARMQANKKTGKKLTPSKYLKKYGNRWHSLKEEMDQAPKEKEPVTTRTKEKVEASKIRRVGIEGSLHESAETLDELSKPVLKSYLKKSKEWLNTRGNKGSYSKKATDQLKWFQDQPAVNNDRKFLTKVGKRVMSIDTAREKLKESFEPTLEEGNRPTLRGMTLAKTAKELRLAQNRNKKDALRDKKSKDEERRSSSGVPHSSGHGIGESVTPAKGTKKDKRPDTLAPELPTMPAGMNAGMRMVAASFDDFMGDLLSELSKDTVASAYKERYAQAKAHHEVGDTEGAKKNATKALRTADYHANHEKANERYAKIKDARAIISKRAKAPNPEADKRLALQKRREARKTLYGDRKKNTNAQTNED